MTDDCSRPDPVRALMARRDLTDPAQGDHPMQQLIERLHTPDAERVRRTLRTPPLVPGPEGWRARHSTTETVLAQLPDLAADGVGNAVVRCAGLVCGSRRSDATALVAHELDIWLLGETASTVLASLVQGAIRTAVPGVSYRLTPARSAVLPGRDFRIDLMARGRWHDVGGCGVLRQEGEPVAVGFSLTLEPLLALSDLAGDQADGNTQTVTSSRS
ncbi:hypothetical protein [Aquisalimonas asiatica]|uniref:Uncharacterized protein n=1 Tax=Aquisalimonas asiatica TaxID=406100 RepID=A0A1H8PSI9_9GAMM|nr:hypothetical protein [Aquisalimonas asiatica]SEO44654.1 hypothetical protein SAMN04488052_101117 [Aquisalimonas asiatica]